MISPSQVSQALSKYILADGFPLVLDLEKSHGSYIVDKNNGDHYLDFFSMFASMAVGYNHPKLLAASEQFGKIAIQKPSNSDAYTDVMAEFVTTFGRIAIPHSLPHAFFIEGGALAVENALKTAFDWKVRYNLSRGISGNKGTKIIHFQQAFHGRSGYTLSLTNTHDPRKTQYFPTFDWPRIPNPKITFPLNESQRQLVIAHEQVSLAQIQQCIAADGDDIAGLIIEPIQGEGGDNQFRPEFFAELRKICNEHNILFILDEVQTGLGITGKMWAYEHYDFEPDIICFGKKTQVCGILAGKRIDEIENNVFAESSRINSTFGGNLIDMARCSHILRIIEEEQLVANAETQGRTFLKMLEELALEFSGIVTNARGKGLMCAFDLPDETTRNAFVAEMFTQKVLVLACGDRSIRFRPHLIVSKDELTKATEIMRSVIKRMLK